MMINSTYLRSTKGIFKNIPDVTLNISLVYVNVSMNQKHYLLHETLVYMIQLGYQMSYIKL